MYTGSVTLRANRAARLAARLLWQSCRGGTRVTLVIITPQGMCLLEPGTGHTTAIRGCTALAGMHRSGINALRSSGHPPSANQAVKADNDPGRNLSWLTSPMMPAASSTLKSRHDELAVTSIAHGPTLDSVLRHLVDIGEHKSSMLWITGLDNAGSGFYDVLGAESGHCSHVMMYVDDPVLGQSLPPGDFHYRSCPATDAHQISGHRSARVTRTNQHALAQTLEQMQVQRTRLFDTLKIPYLTTASGDDEIIAALRYQAVIA